MLMKLTTASVVNNYNSNVVRKKVGGGSESSATSDSMLTKEGKPRKRDPVDPGRCIYSCESCAKAFTTKFNLKRHINLHCNKSKEAGVPVQGPPSASTPSRKARERREAEAAALGGQSQPKPVSKKKAPKTPKPRMAKANSKVVKQTKLVSQTPTAVTTVHPINNQNQQFDQSRVKFQQLPPYQALGQNQHSAESASFSVNNISTQQIQQHSQQQQQQQHQLGNQMNLVLPQQQQVQQHQNHQQIPYQPLSESTLQMTSCCCLGPPRWV